MSDPLSTLPSVRSRADERSGAAPRWALRIEGRRVAVVLHDAPLPGGARLGELAIHLPHVTFPFDFRDGVERFRHHRGEAEIAELTLESRVLLDQVHQRSGGRLGGRAADDAVILHGRAEGGARFTVRGRFLPDPSAGEGDDPTLILSLYDVRVYGSCDEPWPRLASRVLDLLPEDLVVDRTLTTARIRPVRPAITRALAELGWKLPDLRGLRARGVELRDGRFTARFVAPGAALPDVVRLDAMADGGLRASLERFIEDLELKRHHGQVDRLLERGEAREALAEVYRALDGPPRPGFLAERLIGICAARPILHDEGERVCRQLLAEAPDYAPALCGLAAMAIARGRREEAAVHLERLAGTLSGPADREDATAADLTLAELLRDSDPAEARASLQRVLERSPDHEEALEQLIALAEAAGDEAAAIPLHKRLLFSARSPDRTRLAGLRLARHALARHDPEEARIFLRVILEASPHDAGARLALADVELEEGHPREAAQILETALRILPATEAASMLPVVKRLARLALDRLDEPGRARRVLWRAIDASGMAEADALTLARLALEAADPDLAIRYARRAEADASLAVRAGCTRARAHLARDEAELALEVALEVLEAAPGDEEALGIVEQAAAGVEVRERLLLQLREAAAAAPDPATRARLHRAVARLFESLDLAADAIVPWEAALEADPRGEAAQRVAERLLDLYAQHGMWPRHQGLCRQLLQHVDAPRERVALLERMGVVALHEQGDAAAAHALLQEAASLAPRRAEVLALWWEAAEALGEREGLIPILRRLAAVHPDPATRGRAGLRLAGLLVHVADAPGEARAVLDALPRAFASGARARELREQTRATRAPLPPASAPASAPTRPTPTRPAEPGPAARYAAAIELADAGREGDAIERLEALLASAPGYGPARELLDVLRAEVPAPSTPELAATRPVAQPPAWLADPGPTDPGPADPEPALPAPVAARLEEGDRLEALLGRASVRAMDGDGAGALVLVDEALAIDGDCVPALELRAELLRDAGDWMDFVDVLERLGDLAFDARETLAYAWERAEVLEEQLGDAERALEAWRRYAAFEPLDDRAYGHLVEALTARAAWDELADLHGARAVAAGERAGEGGRAYAREQARSRLAEARVRLFQLDAPDGAVAAAEDGLAASPDDPELLEVQVRALAMSNQRVACRAALDRLLPLLLDGPLKDEMRLLRGV